MLSESFKIASSIPGRIRLKIPELYKNNDYAIHLETLLKSEGELTKIVIDFLSSSLIIYYASNSLTEAEVQEKVEIILKKIRQEKIPDSREIALEGYRSINLTPYEYLQAIKIHQWRSKNPAFLTALIGKFFSPIKVIANFLIPDSVIRNLIKDIELNSRNWQKTWEHLKPKAEVDDYRQLKQAPLEKCDRLAYQVKHHAVTQASFRGGITGFFDWLGEIADVGLMISLAVTTIHKIGLCYGYSPVTLAERQFTWAILKVATAFTEQERQEGTKLLHHFQHILYQDSKRAIEDILEDSTVGTMEEGAVEEMISGIIQTIFDDEIGEIIPVLGIGMGIIADCEMIEEITLAAQREFQLRWLLEKKKLTLSHVNQLN